MAKRLTPIERAIAGEPQDRRERYAERLRGRGLTYARVLVPVGQVEALRAVARQMVAAHDVSADGAVSVSADGGDDD